MGSAATVLATPRRRTRQTLSAGRAPVREVYFVKHIDNSRIVREINAASNKECYALGGLMVLGFILCLAYACQHFQCVRYGYEIEQLRQQERSLLQANRMLKLEEASLEDPQVIDAEAHAELGLTEPDPRQVVRVDRSSSRQLPASEPQLAESRPGFGALWVRLSGSR